MHSFECRLEKTPKIIKIFQKGEAVSFTEEKMYILFKGLIDELNRLAKQYYNVNPRFNLNKPYAEQMHADPQKL